MRYTGAVLEFTAAATPTKPVSCFFGSGSAKSDRTGVRSANGTALSSPTIETSRSALRIPCLDEKSRYTVAGGTSDSVLIASIVVAPYPRSRNSVRAASMTASARQAGPGLAPPAFETIVAPVLGTP